MAFCATTRAFCRSYAAMAAVTARRVSSAERRWCCSRTCQPCVTGERREREGGGHGRSERVGMKGVRVRADVGSG
eukprot:1199914-Prymnesium_polylepis.2